MPKRWWSDYEEGELRPALAGILQRDPSLELVEVGVEGPHGAAWAITTDGKKFRFAGDGHVTAFEEVPL